MECIKLVLEDKNETSVSLGLIEAFEQKHNIDILEHSLIQNIQDTDLEVMYSFFEEDILEDFIYDLIEFGIRIKKRENFTESLFEIIDSNKVGKFKERFDYTIGFEDILENFYLKHRPSDNIMINIFSEKKIVSK